MSGEKNGAKAGNGQAAAAGGARPAVLSLSIKEKAALYAAYMPYLKNGGMFVPTTRPVSAGRRRLPDFDVTG